MSNFGENRAGRFLQVGGVKVVYDVRQPPGRRVVMLMVKDGEGECYQEVESERMYSVVVSSYMAGGGDGYSMLTNSGMHIIGGLDTDVLREAIVKNSPISSSLQNRILMIKEESGKST